MQNANISGLDNPAANFPQSEWSLSGLLTGGTGNLNLLNLIFFFIGLAFFANLISAALGYIGSQGDPSGISKANTRITTSIIGLIVAFAAFVIVRFVATLFGFQALVPIS